MITVNLQKAIEIAHTKRRNIRLKKFLPSDEIVAKQIPNEVEKAEQSRQAIRESDAVLQENIDSCKNVEELKSIVESMDV